MIKHRLPGMTLIELLATITILGLVTVFAIPSFRALQGRQDMRVAQGVIQSALYRLDQLALAPPAITQDSGQATDFDIVGYGLVFYPLAKNSKGTATLANCTISVTNDFVAVIKYVRLKTANSIIKPMLMPADPTQTGACNVVARSHSEDIYTLPARVAFGERASQPALTDRVPWLVTQPLASVGTSVGALSNDPDFTNPFGRQSTPFLAIRHTSIKVEEGLPLCYGITLSRYSEAVRVTSKLTKENSPQGCKDD